MTKMILMLLAFAFVASTTAQGASGDVRRFLVIATENAPQLPGEAFNASEEISKYNFILKNGRPGSMPIPNIDASGNGKIETGPGANLCGDKIVAGSYVVDDDFSTDGNNRTYDGMQLLGVQGAGVKNENFDVFIQNDPDATPVTSQPKNGVKFDKWTIQDDNDTAPGETTPVCRVATASGAFSPTWYIKYTAEER